MPYDPVCGVQVDEDDALTANYQGQLFYFDSEDCRQEFLEAPEEYVGEDYGVLAEEEEL